MYRHGSIEAALKKVHLCLLMSLTPTLRRDIQEREGHSARAYYIRVAASGDPSSYSG